MKTVDVFASAGQAFVDLVGQLPQNYWDRPGLGEWDIRRLVGHTSLALTTVTRYLDSPAEEEEISRPEDYFASLHSSLATMSGDILARGQAAGETLGDHPVEYLTTLLSSVISRLHPEAYPLISTRAGGMRLSNYLPTRTFELIAHSFDIAAAAQIPFAPPALVLAETVALAARIACALDRGSEVVKALLGRDTLPSGFSVVG